MLAADAAAGFSDFFVARSGDAFFEIDEARGDEDRVSVGIDETGKDDLVGAVDFFRRLRVTQVSAQLRGANLGHPILQLFAKFVGGADGGDFAVFDEYGTVFDDAEVAHLAEAAARRRRHAASEAARRASEVWRFAFEYRRPAGTSISFSASQR